MKSGQRQPREKDSELHRNTHILRQDEEFAAIVISIASLRDGWLASWLGCSAQKLIAMFPPTAKGLPRLADTDMSFIFHVRDESINWTVTFVLLGGQHTVHHHRDLGLNPTTQQMSGL